MEPKTLSEITRKEWIVYEWNSFDEFEQERAYLRGPERTPSEAVIAAEEWDFLESIKNGDGE